MVFDFNLDIFLKFLLYNVKNFGLEIVFCEKIFGIWKS